MTRVMFIHSFNYFRPGVFPRNSVEQGQGVDVVGKGFTEEKEILIIHFRNVLCSIAI